MKIALLGHGTVGSGVAEIIQSEKFVLSRAGKEAIELKSIFDKRNFSSSPYAGKFVGSFSLIENDDEINTVIEAMGGLNPAYEYVKSSIEHGKNVVTSNKELVAEKGAELLKLAKEKNVNFLFEASVGGGIPLIHPVCQCMAHDVITEIAGILNGTTNYILTRMFSDGASYDCALEEAQKLGYAELCPDADVLGTDACRKTAILSSLIWGYEILPSEIKTEGISNITEKDVASADKLGYLIKLLVRAKVLPDGNISAEVSPTLIKRSSILSSVSGVNNAVLIRSENNAEVLFYGSGAGKMPTASAVVSDIIEISKAKGKIPEIFWDAKENRTSKILPYQKQKYFIRTSSDRSFITGPFDENELLDAGKSFEHGEKIISKIPVFE